MKFIKGKALCNLGDRPRTSLKLLKPRILNKIYLAMRLWAIRFIVERAIAQIMS